LTPSFPGRAAENVEDALGDVRLPTNDVAPHEVVDRPPELARGAIPVEPALHRRRLAVLLVAVDLPRVDGQVLVGHPLAAVLGSATPE
jgi:hypothetical protein